MRQTFVDRNFREMKELEELIAAFGSHAHTEVIETVNYKNIEFPIYTVILGNRTPKSPTVGFFGGVHGLERIGSDVILSYMRTILELVKWDKSFQQRLQESTLVFMPIVNPIGIARRSRSNGNGVDLMRNSPINCEESQYPLVSGQNYSSKLPWYRGDYQEGMEIEAKALCHVVETYLFPSKLSMAIDVHSGFGARDRFWFPYAHSKKPFPDLAEVYAFTQLLNQTYPHHVYEIEPVSRQYTIQGDLWDYLYLKNEQNPNKNFFLPWTLEMGSWNWLRKNPFQIFNPWGIYHPIKPHRRSRTLRRHMPLFDFVHRSCLSPDSWRNLQNSVKEDHRKKALEAWYE
ncbi:MAG: DUF2817 domain-containing protein [Bdellovibrionales bacterium]|nr:DUF2817 domain-containing protein [Bdellovibrionales bacterium]